jgi:hypothetical protein
MAATSTGTDSAPWGQSRAIRSVSASVGRLSRRRLGAAALFSPSSLLNARAVSPITFLRYAGRRIDFLMRSIECPLDSGPVEAIRYYLTTGATDSARELARKAVVLIEPANLRGRVVWPIEK